jgi:hypothetical protein
VNKWFVAIVPVCVIFGPLFMTRIGGTVVPETGRTLVMVGVLMLAAGLVVMFRLVLAQQKVIETLQAERRVNA